MIPLCLETQDLTTSSRELALELKTRRLEIESRHKRGNPRNVSNCGFHAEEVSKGKNKRGGGIDGETFGNEGMKAFCSTTTARACLLPTGLETLDSSLPGNAGIDHELARIFAQAKTSSSPDGKPSQARQPAECVELRFPPRGGEQRQNEAGVGVLMARRLETTAWRRFLRTKCYSQKGYRSSCRDRSPYSIPSLFLLHSS